MALTSEAKCAAPTGDKCGEGIAWCPEENAVYWTDINRFLIHRFDPVTRDVRSWMFDEPATTVMLTDRDGTFAVTLGSRVILWKPSDDSRRDLGFQLPGWPAVRLNDAGVDPRGAMWVGSMQNNVNPDGSEGPLDQSTGALYRIEPDGSGTQFQDRIGVSNTFVWSPDRERFYFGDTFQNAIWAHDFNENTGDIGKPGPFFSGFTRGLPDGSAIDEQGYVWNCRWDGACVVRVAPDGNVDHVVEIPARNITNCTFGGKDMNILYVTSAASADPGDRLAGSLFAVETEVRGLPDGRFKLPRG
ncbi:MAG: SMP-30/gluconolactonase/LRE family protein [Bryobacteraceae bacterium]